MVIKNPNTNGVETLPVIWPVSQSLNPQGILVSKKSAVLFRSLSRWSHSSVNGERAWAGMSRVTCGAASSAEAALAKRLG